MTIALKTQKQILASQLNNRINERIEEALKQDIQQFFETLKNKVLASFDEYYNETLLLQGHVNLILSPIHEAHKDYYDLLLSKNLEMFRRGSLQAERLVNRLEQSSMKAAKPVKFKHKEEEHFGTLKYSEDFLSDYTFVATDKTLSRIDKDINKILTEGYREGWGVKDVRNRIMERYDQFKGWEANRIARTEMQTAHNMGMMNGYESQGVEYIEWRSAIHQPKRTRKSHLKLNGEIIPFGGTFSNDLAFPGDKSGEIEEWINCRCSVVPFLMPYGKAAPPGMLRFRESDLISVEGPNYDALLRRETGGRIGWEDFLQLLEGRNIETGSLTRKQQQDQVEDMLIEIDEIKDQLATEINPKVREKLQKRLSELQEQISSI